MNARFYLIIPLMILFLAGTLSGSVEIQEEDYVLLQPRSILGEGIYNNGLQLVIDGDFAGEGDPWNSDRCVYWEDEEAYFIFDLGAIGLVVDLLLQVDDNDIYTVDYSLDGVVFSPFHVFYVGYGESDMGLDTMSTNPGNPHYASLPEREPVRARFLRLRASSGDGKYALAELHALGYPEAEAESSEYERWEPENIQGFGEFSHSIDLIIDGYIPAEGSSWEGEDIIAWSDPETYFIVDLGRRRNVAALEIQVNGQNGYRIDYSLDDQTYISLVKWTGTGGEIESGMETLSTDPASPEYVADLDFFPVDARYIKIYAVEGLGPFAVSELQIFGR
jgi:hypothetical protein